MRKISADYVFPVASEPIKNAVVVTSDNGKILEIGKREDYDHTELQVLNGYLVPGFINTHCHLELSHMKGMLPENTGLIEFIKGVLSKREASEEAIQSAISDADKEMYRNGIVAVGDISNVNDTFNVKANSKIKYHTFVEVFNLVPEAAEETFKNGEKLFEELQQKNLPASIVPHAPYTVSPELFRLINGFNIKKGLISSMHNQETKDENDFFLTKTGGFNDFYKQWGFDISFFTPTGKRSLESVLPYFSDDVKLLLVHNTMCNKTDIKAAQQKSKNIYWCFNPNANLYIENTLPDYNLFIEEGTKCTIGTDSLASNWQLSILEEMKVISKKVSQLPFETLLNWATLSGAEFLGMDKDLGSIEIGKTPGLNLIQEVDHANKTLSKNSSVLKIC